MWRRRNEELGSSEEERSLSRLGELLLLVERTKKAAAMPATAAQCFGSTETLQAYLHPPVREFSSNKPDDFPWRAQRERCFNVLVVSLLPHAPEEEDSFQLLPR